MTAKNQTPACRRCSQTAGGGVLLLLDEQGAICAYCRSLEMVGKSGAAEVPSPAGPPPAGDLALFRSFCQEIQDSTAALDVFLFSSHGSPLGYAGVHMPSHDLAEMGDLISSVIASYEGIFDILGGDHGFILVGKEECHCLVRTVPPRLIIAVIVEPEYPLEELKKLLGPFVERLEGFQKESSGAKPSLYS